MTQKALFDICTKRDTGEKDRKAKDYKDCSSGSICILPLPALLFSLIRQLHDRAGCQEVSRNLSHGRRVSPYSMRRLLDQPLQHCIKIRFLFCTDAITADLAMRDGLHV